MTSECKKSELLDRLENAVSDVRAIGKEAWSATEYADTEPNYGVIFHCTDQSGREYYVPYIGGMEYDPFCYPQGMDWGIRNLGTEMSIRNLIPQYSEYPCNGDELVTCEIVDAFMGTDQQVNEHIDNVMMMRFSDIEEWRPVRNRFFVGNYEVSSYGNVRRLKPASRTRVGHYLKKPKAGGYEYVCLSATMNGVQVRKRFYVHRLVAETFCADTYFDGAYVNHRNNIKTDNRSSNLEWCTQQQNMRHYFDLFWSKKNVN